MERRTMIEALWAIHDRLGDATDTLKQVQKDRAERHALLVSLIRSLCNRFNLPFPDDHGPQPPKPPVGG